MSSALPEALIAGATGRTGEALINALLSSGRYGKVHLLTNQPMETSSRHFADWHVDEQQLSPNTITGLNAPAVRDVFLMLFADRLHSGRDVGVHGLTQAMVEPLARAAAAAGAERLFLVCPLAAHEQMSQFIHFYGGADTTLALAAMPFQRICILLPTEMPRNAANDGFWAGFKRAYLGQFRMMLPQSVTPFTPERFCRAVLKVAEQEGRHIEVFDAAALHKLLKTQDALA